MPEPNLVKNVLIPYGIFLGIFFLALVIPQLGVIAEMLTPLPLILIYLQRGKVIGLMSVFVVFCMLLGLVGAPEAIIFFIEYAVMALVMAETIRLRFKFEKTIFYGALASTVLSIVFLFIMVTGKESTPGKFLEKQFHDEIEKYIVKLEKANESPNVIDELRDYRDKFSKVLSKALPGLIAVGSLLVALVNYLLFKGIWFRYYSSDDFKPVDLTQWNIPDSWVWFLIVAAGSFFVGVPAIETVALNFLIILSVLYFFQGVAVSIYFLRSKGIHKVLWVLFFFVVLTQPIFIIMIVGLGLFDIWGDYRKVRPLIPKVPE